MTIDKRDVTFKSGDSFAAGWFFLPEHAGSGTAVPAVAMAHGIGAVKEMFLEPIARRFADAGLAVLVFDYRSFGASGGEPRGAGRAKLGAGQPGGHGLVHRAPPRTDRDEERVPQPR